MPWNRDASAPRFNPLGKIPVLMLDDGECICESRLIVEYLELKYPQPALFARLSQRESFRQTVPQAQVLSDRVA